MAASAMTLLERSAMRVRFKATTQGLKADPNRLNEALVGRYLTYLGMQRASPNTVTTYENGLRNFLRFLCGQSILAVKHADLLLYLSDLERRGLSKSSAANHLYAFRSFSKFCALVGLQCSSAFQRMRLPKQSKRLTEFHPLSEIERLIAATGSVAFSPFPSTIAPYARSMRSQRLSRSMA